MSTGRFILEQLLVVVHLRIALFRVLCCTLRLLMEVCVVCSARQGVAEIV